MSSLFRPRHGRRPRPDVVHSSVYLPDALYEALRETAFKERCKIHDLVLQGIVSRLGSGDTPNGGTQEW